MLSLVDAGVCSNVLFSFTAKKKNTFPRDPYHILTSQSRKISTKFSDTTIPIFQRESDAREECTRLQRGITTTISRHSADI